MSNAGELPKTGMLMNLLKCTYSDLEKEAAAGMFLGSSDIEVFHWGKNGPEVNIASLSPLKKLFHQFCSSFKHIGFKEEREWRLAFHMLVEHPALGLIQFRDGLTPYIKVPLKLKSLSPPLKQIVVGPSQNKGQIVDSLKLQLKKMNINGVEVVPSKIPCRNW